MNKRADTRIFVIIILHIIVYMYISYIRIEVQDKRCSLGHELVNIFTVG